MINWVFGCGDFRPFPQRETVALDTPVKFAMSVPFRPPSFCSRAMN